MTGMLQSLNALDWMLIVLVSLSAIAGFMRGLVRSLTSLAGIIVGIVVAGWYALPFGTYLARWITPLLAAEVIAFLVIALATMLLFALAGRALRGTAKVVGLGFADRCGGALFGMARGILLIAAALLPTITYVTQTELAKKSFLLPGFLQAAHGISFVLPRNFKDRVAASLHHPRDPAQR